MTMASSKKNLTEQETIIEGLMDTLLQKFLMGRAKNVLSLIKHDKNLAAATKKLEKSSAEWKKALKKTATLQAKLDGDGGALLKRLRGN